MPLVTSKKGKKLTLLFLALLTLILVPASITVGLYKASFADVIRVLLTPGDDALTTIVWNLRLRRVLAGVVIGAVLGGSGAAVQASMRNPMASPFTFGLSFAASLGVAIALLVLQGGAVQRYQVVISNPFVVSLFAFAFSLIQVMVVLSLAYRAGLTALSLVLSAIATSFAYQALLYLLQYFYLNEIMVSTVVFWTFGDLGRISWSELTLVSVFSFAVVIPYFLLRSLDFDLILGGDELAKSSGVSPQRLRLETVIVAALATALATSFVGVIAFVCLAAPHVARLILGSGHRYLMPASMLVGSLLLTASDTIGRTIIAPTVIPVGIVTSLIGAPLLVYLLIGGRGRGYRDTR